MITEKEWKVDVSKRKFIKRAAAALGVVAASAGFANILVSAPSDNKKRSNMNYTSDDLRQERVISQKQFVIMTDEEKKKMLDEILNNYHKELT